MFDVSGGVGEILGFDIKKVLIVILVLLIIGLGSFVGYALYVGSKQRTLHKFEKSIALSIAAAIFLFMLLVILL